MSLTGVRSDFAEEEMKGVKVWIYIYARWSVNSQLLRSEESLISEHEMLRNDVWMNAVLMRMQNLMLLAFFLLGPTSQPYMTLWRWGAPGTCHRHFLTTGKTTQFVCTVPSLALSTPLKSVKCYSGQREIDLIQAKAEILPQTC